jgi:general secretion pathway protein K
MHAPSSAQSSERGAALFAVLAMVALLAGLTAIGLDRIKAATADALATESRAETQMATTAAVVLAQGLIMDVKARANRNVAMTEAPITLPLHGRTVTLQFRNAGGCFNLNSIGSEQGGTRALGRLLSAAGLSPAEAGRIAASSRDIIARQGLMLADPSEWRAMAGVTRETFALLEPLLCTLPTREPSGFNINSLSESQLPVLVALGLSPEQARKALAARPAAGWTSTSEFWKAASGGEPDNLPEGLVGTTARWFMLDVLVSDGETDTRRKLVLDSTEQPARVVASQWLPPLPAVRA